VFVIYEQRSTRTFRGSWMALAGLSAVFLFEMLDNSILNVALPTIGRELHSSTTALQWVTGAYSVVFGGLMLLFGAIADRFGRRRVMLIGLALLALASLATAFVTTAEQLIAVRAVMGIAAAMTTPGSMALAFRLFDEESLRVRAITLISTVGLVGLAIGPTVGGLVLAVAPWQVLLLVNVPIALLALVGIRAGIAADDPAELHRDPLDIPGALLATATIVFALVAPTMFVDDGAGSWMPWAMTAAAILAAAGFVLRERSAQHPLLDLGLLARPLVSSGLAFKAGAGLATAGLSYLVTLQLQLAWGWPPALAALGMLPQVVVLLALGPFVNPFVQRVGIRRAAWLSAAAVVAGLAVYAVFNSLGYVFVAIALALVAAGLRVVGVVAAVTVLSGLPKNRTTIGAALADTTTEVANGVGIAVAGTILAAVFTGSIAASGWTAQQAAEFQGAATLGGLVLTVVAAAFVVFGIFRSRRAGDAEHDSTEGAAAADEAAVDPAA
jgi:MFS family permease